MNVLHFLEALLVLAVMIFIHELGHYTAGRLLGFKIIDFSIGFGPALLKIKSKKTEITYALRAIPLGGACRFYGEEDDKLDDAIAFNSQKPWKRLIVVFAGPFMNFVLAYVLAVVTLAGYGAPAYKTYANGEEAVVIVGLTPAGPAELSGVSIDDVIISVGDTSIENAPSSFDDKTEAVSNALKAASPDGVKMTVQRGDKLVELFISNIYNKEQQRNLLGITMGLKQEFVRSEHPLSEAGAFLVNIVTTTFEAITNGFRNGFNEGEISGVVGTVAITMNMASKGLYYVLLVMVIISMSLGIMNLLPLLPMDGGHLLFDFIELIFRKPVPRKIQNVLSIIGVVLLLALMVYATIGDIKGIFNGLFNF